MKTLFNLIVFFSIVICFGWNFPITSLIIIIIIFLFTITLIISNWKFMREARLFYKKNDGKYILWLGSNKRYQYYVQHDLIKLLNFQYIKIQTDRDNTVTDFSRRELRFLQLKMYKQKLPVLFKIKNKKLACVSFFDEINQLKYKQISVEEFEQRIQNKIKNL